jgi:hypothetical protein
MNKIVFITLALLFRFSMANTVLVYTGVSPVVYNTKNECRVELMLNSNQQVIAVSTQGPAKQWEIIAENGSSYGPRSEVILDRGDDMLAKPETFSRLRFERVENILSEGFVLKSNVSAESGIRGQFEIEFKVKNSMLISLKKKSKFKIAYVLPLASQELVCDNLKKINQR